MQIVSTFKIIPLQFFFLYLRIFNSLFFKKYANLISFNPISTGGGGVFSTPIICFLPVTFLFLSQFPPNLVTFLKFNTELSKNKNFWNFKPGSRDMTIFGGWFGKFDINVHNF